MKATLHLLLRPPLALGMKATEAALRLGLSATAGQSQARRRRQRLLLPPLASHLAPSPPSSAHRLATLRTHLPLPSRLRWTVEGARTLRLRRARPAGNGSQQPLLHQGGRAALGTLMPQSEALPVRLALQRALSVAFLEPCLDVCH